MVQLVDFHPDNNWPVTYIESLQLVWAFYRSADYLGSYYGVPLAVFLQGLLNMERVAGISLISAITVSRHTGLGHYACRVRCCPAANNLLDSVKTEQGASART